VQILSQSGAVLAEETYQGNNFNNLADATVQCANTHGSFNDGYFNVDLSADYNLESDGDVTVRITNTLD
jgi:hypothetical protein